MLPRTRAMVAAAAFAFVTGKKVAGVFDHSAGRDLRIAAEVRGDVLQGHDRGRKNSPGDPQGARFGGTLPEILDTDGQTYVSFEITGTRVTGYDRGTSSAFTAEVKDGLVQVFDHSQDAWFAYDIQDADAAQSYHREAL